MGIWSNLRSISSIMSKGEREVKKGRDSLRGKKMTSRGLRMEQFEDRILLSVSPTGVDDYDCKSLLLNQAITEAVQTASNLGQYSEQQLKTASGWVVCLDSEADSLGLADAVGADQKSEVPYIADAYVWQFSTDTSWKDAVSRLDSVGGVNYYYPLVQLTREARSVPNDTLYPMQWHLENTGQIDGISGVDINVNGAWDTVSGAGVNIVIVDDGVEYTHPDLVGRYMQAFSYDYGNNDRDPMAEGENNHGTSVTGLATASGNNGLGVVGSGYGANYAAVIYGNTDLAESLALGTNIESMHIYNNSWGPNDQLAVPQAPGPLTMAALELGATTGRNGLGVIYTWAGGNGRESQDNVNYDGYANSRFTIAVGAVNHQGKQSVYSESGASLFIVAPSSDGFDEEGNTLSGIVTTDRTGDAGYNSVGTEDTDALTDTNYTTTFGGTSAATPIVTGVVALMLEANPALTNRDVQYILQQTAYKNDPDDEGWYRNDAGIWVNHKYGFGLIDATAAVEAARTWETVAEDDVITSGVIPVNQRIPDNNTTGVRSTVTMPNTIGQIEYVEVKVNIPHTYTGDLEIVLVSPTGTQSVLAEVHNTDFGAMFGMADGYNEWTFTTVQDWGERSGGEWSLIVRDLGNGNIGTFEDWQLNIYGVPSLGTGPDLIAVIPNEGALIQENDILNHAPEELTLRFTLGQILDETTLDAIEVWRAGNDGEFDNDSYQVQIGYMGLSSSANEVILRFAQPLVDDQYQIRIRGNAVSEEDLVLRNTNGMALGEEKEGEGGKDLVFSFELDLGAQITTVVPQPVLYDAAGTVTGQARNQIDVYFNNDQLNKASVERIDLYALLFTNDTEDTRDDTVVYPHRVEYTWDETARVGKAVLLFERDLAEYGVGAFRLSIGEMYREYETRIVNMNDSMMGDNIGDSYSTAENISTLVDATNWFGSSDTSHGRTLVINGSVGGLQSVSVDGTLMEYDVVWPGGNDEPGHRLQTEQQTVASENHILDWDYADADRCPGDSDPGIAVWTYAFPGESENGFTNLMNESMKEGCRQILALISANMGIQFVEVENPADGSRPLGVDLQMYVGDLAILQGDSGPGGVAGLGGGGIAVLDSADFGFSSEGTYGSSFTSVMMHEIMHSLGFGHTYDLDPYTIMGEGSGENSYGDEYYSQNAEAVFPGNYDVVHGQYLYRMDSMDVDLYRFVLDVEGKFNAEIVSERLEASSLLDTVLILFNSKGEIIARNDDYFSNDSFFDIQLSAGEYYIGVSSIGNDDYDPTILNSGMNGSTEGDYQLRMSFMPQIPSSSVMVDTTEQALDGDADGVSGGSYNTWFNVRTTEHTLFVNKAYTGSIQDGTLEHPYRNIDDALQDARVKKAAEYSTSEHDVIIRVLGNNFINDSTGIYDGTDKTGSVEESGLLTDNLAYEIGWNSLNVALQDGNKLDLPKGVNMIVDEGVVIKLRQANIDVGSRDTGIDRSRASLQVLGTPYHPVKFTSYNDESIGVDTYAIETSPAPGDWGGIVLRNNVDYDNNADVTKQSRIIMEDIGVFLNTISFADIQYGGGRVNTGGQPLATGSLAGTAFTPIYMDETRATVVHNTMTNNSNAVISADPNSFKESHYFDSTDVTADINDGWQANFTRVGPFIRNNTLAVYDVLEKTDTEGNISFQDVVYTNSMNALLIRVDTVTGGAQEKLEVTARFDDFDITHVLSDTLILAGNTTGPIQRLDTFTNLVTGTEARPDGGLHIDPGIILKMNNARIETEGGAHLIAEGLSTNPIIFTSVYDDRYGTGGIYDTTHNGGYDILNPTPEREASAGNWSGFYLNPDSNMNFDSVRIMYAGGDSAISGEYATFCAIESRQGNLRIANSTLDSNAVVSYTEDARDGHGTTNDAGVIRILNGRSIIVNNTFTNNGGPIISVNANALHSKIQKDTGRVTGLLTETNISDTDDFHAIYSEYSDNAGPLVRENRTDNNAINGMLIRGETLTVEGVWDDIDIVHVLTSDITIPNLHTYGGLRLQSSSKGSLVVKLQGANAGFTVSGTPEDIDDRIGGTLQIVGMPEFPVIMTSLSDDTVGAGYTTSNAVATNTNNLSSKGTAGEWRGIVLDEYSNDRNVAVVIEAEPSAGVSADLNGLTSKAQYLGALAANLKSGDENLRLGFEVHGAIRSDSRTDSDVYSFSATPGTEIWVDIDETSYALDTRIELLDFEGNVLATSKYSVNETNELSGSVMSEMKHRVLWAVEEQVRMDRDLFRMVYNEAYPGQGGVPQAYDTLSDVAKRYLHATTGWQLQEANIAAEHPEWTAEAVTLELERRVCLEENAQMYAEIYQSGYGNSPVQYITYDSSTIAVQTLLRESQAWEDFLTEVEADIQPTEEEVHAAVVTYLNIPENLQNLFLDLGWEEPEEGTIFSDLNSDVQKALEETTLWAVLSETQRVLLLPTASEVEAEAIMRVRANWEEFSTIYQSVLHTLPLTPLVYDNLSETEKTALQNTGTWIHYSEQVQAEWTQQGLGSSMQDNMWNRTSRDYYGTNLKDAGMRIVLPGSRGTTDATNVYYLRVTSNVPQDLVDAQEAGDTVVNDGKTCGTYVMQVRMQEKQEKPGTIISYANIFYSQTGIEINGIPTSSPLLVETGDIEGTLVGLNDTRDTAQFIGNMLESNKASLALSGYLGNAADVDWYTFDVSIPGLQVINAEDAGGGETRYPITFDVDYADGLGRPDIDLWVFNEAGQLILYGNDTAVVDDLAGPMTSSDLSSLNRGSEASGDASIGPIMLPVGTYTIAVAHAGRMPGIMNEAQVRNEPMESTVRIVEDNIDGTDATGIADQRTESLNLRPESYTLGNVRLYIGTTEDVFSVNPFTGQIETDWTGQLPGQTLPGTQGAGFEYRDLVLRNDSRLYTVAYTQNRANERTVLRELNLGDMKNLVSDTNTGIISYSPGNTSPNVTHLDGSVIQLEALVAGVGRVTGDARINRGWFSVGNSTDPAAGVGSSPTTNLLYWLNDAGVAVSYPVNGVNETRLPSDPVPLASVFTGPTLVFDNATDTLFQAPPSNNTFANPGDILDGTSFVVSTTVGTGMNAVQMELTFELDCGYDVEMSPQGTLSFYDGDTFTLSDGLTTKTFEFDSGPVLAIGSFDSMFPTVDAPNIIFSITRQDGTQSRFEILNPFIDENAAAEGNVGIEVTEVMTPLAIAGVIAEAINGVEGLSAGANFWDVNGNGQYDNDGVNMEPGRVTVFGEAVMDSPIYAGNGAGFMAAGLGMARVGDYGVSDGNIPIAFEETNANQITAMQALGNNIVAVVNANFPNGTINAAYAFRNGEQFDEDGNVNIRLRTVGDRLTFYGATEANFNSTGAHQTVYFAGANNDLTIRGNADDQHTGAFYNNVQVRFVQGAALDVQYEETWNELLQQPLVAGELVITYVPGVTTAREIMDAINNLQVVNATPGVAGLLFQPFTCELTQTDTTNNMYNNGTGVVNFGPIAQTFTLGGGATGCTGLSVRTDAWNFNTAQTVLFTGDGVANNDILFSTRDLPEAEHYAMNGTQIRVLPDTGLADGQAAAEWNDLTHVLTVRVGVVADLDGNIPFMNVTANTIINAVNNLGSPITARLYTTALSNNTGVGAISGITKVTDVVTSVLAGGVNQALAGEGYNSSASFSGSGVHVGSIAIPFSATSRGEEIARTISNVVNTTIESIENFQAAVTLSGNMVTIAAAGATGDFLIWLPGGSRNNPLNTAMRLEGEGAGGLITGMAYVGDVLYAVSDAGGLYRIDGLPQSTDEVLTAADYNFEIYNPAAGEGFTSLRLRRGNLPITTSYIGTLQHEGMNVAFSGLTAGPVHVENGVYSEMLFATDETGNLYAFDTLGNFMPVLYDGNYTIPLATSTDETPYLNTEVTGLAFSTLDFNLWDVTQMRATDEGHGVNVTFNGSRVIPVPGGASYYYGLDSETVPDDFRINHNGTNPDLYSTYDTPGGNAGGLVTDEFSLVGYTAGDKPTLTFNYLLDTDGHAVTDGFKVYITSFDENFYNYIPMDDNNYTTDRSFPTLTEQQANPQWVLIGSNNDGADGGVTLRETGDGWSQAVISLSEFAGLDNIRLRFDFSTSGTVGLGDTNTTGDWLYGLPGYRIISGDVFTISDANDAFDFGDPEQGIQDFEFISGYKMLIPAAANEQIYQDDWFRVESRQNPEDPDAEVQYVDFYFVKDGGAETPSEVPGEVRRWIHITKEMTPVDVANAIMAEVNLAVMLGELSGDITAMLTQPSETLLGGEYCLNIEGAGNVILGTARPITPDMELSDKLSVDGELPNNYVGSITLETVDRIQVSPGFQVEADGALGILGMIQNTNYQFSICDRFGSFVTFQLGGMAVGDVQIVNIANTFVDPNNPGRNSIVPGDIDGDWDLDTQDLITNIVRALDEAVAEGLLQGITVYGSADSVVIRGANYVLAEDFVDDQGLMSFTHTWKKGGETKLFPDAVAVEYSSAMTAAEVTAAIAEAFESHYNRALPGNSAALMLNTGTGNTFNDNDWIEISDGVTTYTFAFDTTVQNEVVPSEALVEKDAVIVKVQPQWDAETVATALAQAIMGTSIMGNVDVVERNGQWVVRIEPATDQITLTFNAGNTDIVGGYDYPEGLENLLTTCKINVGDEDKLRIIGRYLMSSGPLPGMNKMAGDSEGDRTLAGVDPRWSYYTINNEHRIAMVNNSMAGGQNNANEGVYIDDIVIGFTERGTMVTGSQGGGATSYVFEPARAGTLTGAYQLEIRQGSSYGTYNEGTGQLGLNRAFDTNDRQTQGLTLQAVSGINTAHLKTFTISDGKFEVQFQFINETLQENLLVRDINNPQITFTVDGAIPIIFSGRESAGEMGEKIAEAINRAYLIYSKDYAMTFDVTASSSGTSGLVNLFGAGFIYELGDPAQRGAGAAITDMCYYQYDDESATYQEMVQGNYATNSKSSMIGDQNTQRAQGLILINQNLIAYSRDYGINVQSASRDETDGGDAGVGSGYAHPGVVANLGISNTENLVPGITIMNNAVAYSGMAGVRISGEQREANRPAGATLFARVVNNTIYGNGRTSDGMGILVENNTSPTLLNNIVANNGVGIRVDGTSAGTVVGTTAYKDNGVNTAGSLANRVLSLGSEAVVLSSTDELFVDARMLNFYPASGSKVIDASRESLEDRPSLVNVREPLGIQNSPIIAPDLDLYGQSRTDDPNSNWVSGTGHNVYKDIGAVDRVDFEGPRATLIVPMDNDISGVDQNQYDAEIFVMDRAVTSFSIQLSDIGTGINDSSVSANSIEVYRWANNDSYNPEDSRMLTLGLDYIFSYDSTNDVITIYPTNGVWLTGYRYQIILANGKETSQENSIRDKAGNLLQPNHPNNNPSDPVEFTGTTQFWIKLSGLDYGDAPDTGLPEQSYPTYRANAGASHVVVPGFMLGTSITNEMDAHSNSDATGDAGDDGLVFKYGEGLFKAGTTVPFTVYVTAENAATTTSVVGYVNAWFDLNGDGTWNADTDYVLQDVPVTSGVNNMEVTIPADAPLGTTYARVRLTSTPLSGTGVDYRGSAQDGEVEDYKIVIVDNYYDYGDAPEVYDGGDPAGHILNYDTYGNLTGPYLGPTRPDPEVLPTWSIDARGDDTSGMPDESNISTGFMVPGQKFNMTFTVGNSISSGVSYVSAWVDYYGNGEWTEVLSDYQVTGSGTYQVESENEIPLNAQNGVTYMRFRISSREGLEATGIAQDGEVEDLAVTIMTEPKDYGDAPDTYGTYETSQHAALQGSAGAYHLINITEDFYLGRNTEGLADFVGVDPETNGKPSLGADGDDVDGNYNDENGITFSRLVPGQQATVTVEVTADTGGYLYGWMDFAKNGVFDVSDLIIFGGCDTQGSVRPTSNVNVNGYYVTTGTYTFTFVVPEGTTAGETYARFRLSDQSVLGTNLFGQPGDAALGYGGYGEVEDYKVNFELGNGIINGYVFNDLNNNGMWDTQVNSAVPTFEYAEVTGTTQVLAGDDSYSRVPLGFGFEYYGKRYTDVYISTDGYVSFGVTAPKGTEPIELPNTTPMIAVFWADASTANMVGSRVSYERGETASGDKYIQVTWEGVGQNGNANDVGNLQNTFCLYMQDSAGGDIVAMRYDALQWTTAASDGGIDGFGAQPALIGFNGGSGSNADTLLINSLTTQEQASALVNKKQYTYRFDPSSGTPGGKEPGIGRADGEPVELYLDLDNDGVLDGDYINGVWVGEPRTYTKLDNPSTLTVNEAGYYEFTGLFAGTYTVRMVPIASTLWSSTYPKTTAAVPYSTGQLGVSVERLDLVSGTTFTLTDGSGTSPRTVTFEFVDTTYNTQARPQAGNYGIYYNVSTTAVDLATLIAKAVKDHAVNGLLVNAISTGNTVIFGAGISDLQLPENGPLTLITSHSNPEQYAGQGGYYTVILDGDDMVSEVNFGAFRKGEISVVDVQLTEGNSGETYVDVTVELTGSFGSQVSVDWSTQDSSSARAGGELIGYRYESGELLTDASGAPVGIYANQALGGAYQGEILGYYLDSSGNIDLNSPIRADYKSASGTYTFTSTPQGIPTGAWQITQITDTALTNNYDFRISGDYLVYSSHDGTDYEVYVYDNTLQSVIWKTENAWDDVYADISGNVVVWSGKVEGRYQVFAYNMDTNQTLDVTPLSDVMDNFDCVNPRVSSSDKGVFLLWEELGTSGTNLWMSDITDGNVGTPKLIYTATAGSTLISESAKLDGNQAVWTVKSNSGVNKVWVYDGISAPQNPLTTGTIPDSKPQIADGIVVMERGTGNDVEIFYYDIATRRMVQVTNNSQADYTPQISDGKIVWQGNTVLATDALGNPVRTNWDIYYYDIYSGTEANNMVTLGVTNVSNSETVYDESPVISGDRIAWRGQETVLQANGTTKTVWNVYYYEIGGTGMAENVTNNNSMDSSPQVSPDMIVWRSSTDAGKTYQVYTAVQEEPSVRETIRLVIYGDITVEQDEIFEFLVSGGTHVVIQDGTAVITILNDDGSMDYGDAPTKYPVKLTENGARHNVNSGYKLGWKIDADVNAYISTDAQGDDMNREDDEDGIILPETLTPGSMETVRVYVTLPEGVSEACLDAWIDFAGNGSWLDDGDQVFRSMKVTSGWNDLMFLVPTTALSGDTYARFRLSADGGLAPTGYCSTGEVEDYRVTIGHASPSGARTLNIQGLKSTQGDVITLAMAEDYQSFTVVVNGMSTTYLTSDYDEVKVDGQAGLDAFTFYGGERNEMMLLWPTQGFFYVPGVNVGETGLSINVVNFQNITAEGNGGEDSVQIYGSYRDDVLTDELVMVDGVSTRSLCMGEKFISAGRTPLYNTYVNNLSMNSSVVVYASQGGSDTANVDSVQDGDVVSARGETLQITNAQGDLVTYMNGFSSYYLNGSLQAMLHLDGTDAPEALKLTSGEAMLAAQDGSYSIMAQGFGTVNVRGTGAGNTAEVQDSAGNDVIQIRPESTLLKSSVNGNMYNAQITGFSSVKAVGGSGGVDRVSLYDSVNDDHLVMSPYNATLSGVGYSNIVTGFEKIYAYANAGGENTAKIYDSVGDDRLYLKPLIVDMFGTGYYNYASGFQDIRVYSVSGGSDRATLMDSAGNDMLISRSEFTSMNGDYFTNQAYGFRKVEVNALSGGRNTAKLYDSALGDLLDAGSNWASMTSESNVRKVTNFDSVEAIATSTSSTTKADTSVTDFLFTTGKWNNLDD